MLLFFQHALDFAISALQFYKINCTFAREKKRANLLSPVITTDYLTVCYLLSQNFTIRQIVNRK